MERPVGVTPDPPDADAVVRSRLEQRYRDLFDGALVGIYVSTPEGRLLACNGAFARLLQFDSIAEAIGTNMTAVYRHPEARAAFVREVREAGRLEHHRAALRRRDGALIDVIETVVGAFDGSGALTELRGFLFDVTASAEAARADARRDRQFRAVFSDATEAMVILDDAGVIHEANRAACTLFSLSLETIVHRRLDSLLMDDGEELAAAWRELLALGEAKREHRVAAASGAARLVECSYRARVQADRHLCIARDITDRRIMEERITQSEKIESVGRLAGGVAHDFNNLLTAILGYTELLLVHRAEDDPDRPDLMEIQKAGQRAAALTQQLLAFSRKQVLLPREVDLNLTVSSLQSMLTRLIREDITLTCAVAPRPAIVKIDPTQIEQVILNLVLNARDALPGGGTIRIEVASIPHGHVALPADHLPAAPEYVRLSVADNGVGISAEARAHLFEPFFTTKGVGQGTGLGLASVYGIVRQSNGVITAESASGAGTTFTMHFPASPSSVVPEATPPPVPAVIPADSGTVLLVEDEAAVRTIISAVLRRHGYRVLEAGTAIDAIALFDEHPGAIDVLLTDVIMPGINGPALAQRLVAIRPEMRVLFISGYAGAGLQLDGCSSNISFLGKPFEASALVAAVRDVLNRATR
ncbi:MAG TPA: ATP-binding protein [Vicinamibacterales bacterium]|jgi:PAS domain S-box-containing protein|nr:ATP-binding protein [Vicinamibacterales bacterium]